MNTNTNIWHDFIQQQALNTLATAPSFISPLTDQGLIALTGEEAARFLHTQLTNDVLHLSNEQARLAGYCSAKGRLLATFLMWKNQDTIFLQLPGSLLATIQKRLQMFVMRAKVQLTDVSDTSVIFGLSGAAVATALRPWFPTLPNTAYTKIDNQHGSLIRVADANGTARYEWITNTTLALSAWPQLCISLPPVAAQAWRLSEIQAGIPHITAATQEQFVPQMINLDIIKGVDFKKGCYPGQEIVARSQYLGKIKRRAMLAQVATLNVAPGTPLFASAEPHQPCGMIINAEANSPHSSTCILEIKLALLENSRIHLGAIDGPPLLFETLPYKIIDVTE